MRHFIVLGFKTTANSEQGELVHLGSDRGEAIGIVNATDEQFVRKQLFELTVPHLSRHFVPGETEPIPQGTETNVGQSRTFADVPGHDALVAAGIDSFDKLAETMETENWQKPISGVGNGIARQIVAFLK